ncbi:uncharacterized protein LOC129567507 isoform X1 [Sitodiplosis mosellana]|nr:uncharacterized protein LOC129567507 isoform X1 [Sitodiplosis mosellana]
MSSPVNIEKKGIFHWKKATTTSSPSSSSRPASQSTSRASSPTKLPASPPKAENTKKIKRSPSDTKVLAERVSRTHVQRYLEQPKISNDIPTSPRAKESVVKRDEQYKDKGTEPIESPLKNVYRSESIDDLGSPFKKVSELIENLDLSLENLSVKSSSKGKHIGDSSKIGDFVSARDSNESIESNDSDFSTACESPLPYDPTQRLLKQIDNFINDTVTNNTDVHKIHVLLAQLSEVIATSEQQYKRRMKNMKDVQDNAFAELFLEKNSKITQLQLDIEVLKRENSKEIARVKSSEELMEAQNEVCHLKEIIAMRNNEINQLTYKLVDAQSYIESLEKEKYARIDVNADDADIRNHFKTLKKALMSNRTLLKLMQTKKLEQNTQS